jgi:hypothetical protein
MLRFAVLAFLAVSFWLLLPQEQSPATASSSIPAGGSTPTLTSTPLTVLTPGVTPTVTVSPTCDVGWKSVPSPAHYDLTSIDFASPNDAWAVGNDAILRWDGLSWNLVPFPTPTPSGDTLRLTSVSVWSATEIWAVGDYGISNFQTIIYHWDGTAWEIIPDNLVSPVGQARHYLNGIAAIAPNQAVAVGSDEADFTTNPIILNCSTALCSQETTLPTNGELFAVDAANPNDIWTVGNTYGNGNALILHYNGSAWQEVPAPSDVHYRFTGISVNTLNDIWAVSYDGASHWDGAVWSLIPSHPAMIAVTALGSNDVWAVGSTQDTHENIWHWDGAQWSGNFSPQVPLLFGVSAATPGDIWAVGPDGNILRYQLNQIFEDVVSNSSFHLYIEELSCWGVINGYQCGSPGEPCGPNNLPYFRPANNITRGQLSKIVALSANLPPITNTQSFEDVPTGSTFHSYIEALYAYHAINGYFCGHPGEPCIPPANLPYFRPNDLSTRGQTAKVVAIVSGHVGIIEHQSFEDVDIDTLFWVYIENLAALNIVHGYPCGSVGEPCIPTGNLPYFRPSSNVTRGQMSKIAVNTFFP